MVLDDEESLLLLLGPGDEAYEVSIRSFNDGIGNGLVDA